MSGPNDPEMGVAAAAAQGYTVPRQGGSMSRAKEPWVVNYSHRYSMLIPGKVDDTLSYLVAMVQVISEQVGELADQVKQLNEGVSSMSTQMDRLKSEVERNTEVDKSAVALLKGLSEQLRSMKDDPARIEQLADTLSNSSNDLAAAVAANTVAEDTTTVNTGGATGAAAGSPTPSGIALSEGESQNKAE